MKIVSIAAIQDEITVTGKVHKLQVLLRSISRLGINILNQLAAGFELGLLGSELTALTTNIFTTIPSIGFALKNELLTN